MTHAEGLKALRAHASELRGELKRINSALRAEQLRADAVRLSWIIEAIEERGRTGSDDGLLAAMRAAVRDKVVLGG